MRKPDVVKPGRRAVRYVLIGLLGAVALVVGLASVWHPVTTLVYGEPHWSDAPPVWMGAGLLVFPVVLLGLAAREVWWSLDLDLMAWREQRQRRGR
jgi:hypothetical protein